MPIAASVESVDSSQKRWTRPWGKGFECRSGFVPRFGCGASFVSRRKAAPTGEERSRAVLFPCFANHARTVVPGSVGRLRFRENPEKSLIQRDTSGAVTAQL